MKRINIVINDESIIDCIFDVGSDNKQFNLQVNLTKEQIESFINKKELREF